MMMISSYSHVVGVNVWFRFHKLVWGSYGMDSQSAVSGLLMGGAEQGQLYVWDAAKIISQDDDPLVHKFTKHTGPVAAIDINPFQVCTLALSWQIHCH